MVLKRDLKSIKTKLLSHHLAVIAVFRTTSGNFLKSDFYKGLKSNSLKKPCPFKFSPGGKIKKFGLLGK